MLVPCRGIKKVSDELAHGSPILAEKVVNLCENQSGHDNEACRGEDFLGLGNARASGSRPGERAEESAGVSDDRRTQS